MIGSRFTSLYTKDARSPIASMTRRPFLKPRASLQFFKNINFYDRLDYFFFFRERVTEQRDYTNAILKLNIPL